MPSSLIRPVQDAATSAMAPAQQLVGDAQTAIAPAQQMLQSGMDAISPYLGTATPFLKTAKGAVKMGQGGIDVGKAYKDRKGDDARYELDNGVVSKTRRGKNGTTTNAFTKKLAAMQAETGTRKIISGGGKVTSGVGAIADAPLLGNGTTPWAGAVGGVGKLVSGGEKLVGGVADAGRRQHAHARARGVEHELLQQGDVSAYAFQGAKHHAGSGRNVAAVKALQGGVKVTNGVVDLAAAGDPTMLFGQLGAKAYGRVAKAAKKGGKAWMAAKENRFATKLERNDQLARGGDQKAMRWMLGHDPKMASASMLMHAQDERATDEQRSEAAKRAGHVLRLGDEGQEEMKTGRLDQFDKIYEGRTGRKMDAKTSRAGGFATRALGSMFSAWDGTVGKVKQARRAKKESKYGMNDANHLQAVEEEYKATRSFRANKQLDEIQDKLEQQQLKAAFEAQKTGQAGPATLSDVWDNPSGLSTADLIKERSEQTKLKGKSNSKVNKKLSGVKAINDGVLADMVEALDARNAPAPQPTLGPPPNRPPPPVPTAAPAFAGAAPTATRGPSLLGNQRSQPTKFSKATPDKTAGLPTPLIGAGRASPNTTTGPFTGAAPTQSAARSPWLALGRGKA